MSVLVPDDNVFEYIHSGLVYAANNRTVDDKYASCVCIHMKEKIWDKECERLARSWCKLNEDSFMTKYIDKVDGRPAHELLKLTGMIPIRAIQLVKYVGCVVYNIELRTIEKVRPISLQEREDYTLLGQWEQQLNAAIVANTQEYKDAKWSS